VESYGEGRYSSTILDLGTRWSWVVTFTPRLDYPLGRISRYHCIRGCIGPRACLNAMEKRKTSCPSQESNPDRPTRSPPLNRLSCMAYITALSLLHWNLWRPVIVGLYLCCLQRWKPVNCVNSNNNNNYLRYVSSGLWYWIIPSLTLAQHLDLLSCFRDFITMERELCNNVLLRMMTLSSCFPLTSLLQCAS
jgi:hypothetical protein